MGRARVGVAVCDPSGILATPLETVARDLTRDAPEERGDLVRVRELVLEHEVIEVVVGLPRHLSGAEGQAAADARAWAIDVAQLIRPVRVRLVDERLSTVDAHRRLHESGRQGRSHRAVVDQVAAQLILQSALDEESATGRAPGEPVRTGRTKARHKPRAGRTTQTTDGDP